MMSILIAHQSINKAAVGKSYAPPVTGIYSLAKRALAIIWGWIRMPWFVLIERGILKVGCDDR